MKPGLMRLIRPLAYLGLLLASFPSTSGATGDLPTIRDAKGRPVPLDVPRGGAPRDRLPLGRVPDRQRREPDHRRDRPCLPRREIPPGRCLRRPRPDPRPARRARRRISPDVPRRPRPWPRPGPALQGRRDPRGVRPRRHRSGPLPRSDRRRLRRPEQAELRPQDPRFEGRRRRRPRRPARRTARNKAVSCPLPEPAARPRPRRPTTATWNRSSSRALHQFASASPGQVASYSLLTFDQARERADDLAAPAADRWMPHWPASPDEGGPFRDARLLSPREIATPEGWTDAGTPEGDPKDTPRPRPCPANSPSAGPTSS